ncbi:DEKNAAC101489 [Brettanomyces naardenensis]|uniref:DEKNAAC101489 n=1 Tax=Brettanomyces naardenensis TaxID=13370 RepID=A0A448YHZ8_BRENA|nr:DEKNAAC101489 [Brettanomyces naardenensis]
MISKTILTTLALASVSNALPYNTGYFNSSSLPDLTSSLSPSSSLLSSSSSSSCSTDITVTSTSSVTIYGSSTSGSSSGSTPSSATSASSTPTPYISGEFTSSNPVWTIYIPQYAYPDITGFTLDSNEEPEGFAFPNDSISLYSGTFGSFTDITSSLKEESTSDDGNGVSASFSGKTSDKYLEIVIQGKVTQSQGTYSASFVLSLDLLDSTVKRQTLDFDLSYTITIAGFTTTNTYLSCSGANCVTTSSSTFISTSAIDTPVESTVTKVITSCKDNACSSFTTTGIESAYTTTQSGVESLVTTFLPLTPEISSSAAATGSTSSVGNGTSLYVSQLVYTTVISGSETVVTTFIPLTGGSTVKTTTPTETPNYTVVTTTDKNGVTTIYTTTCPLSGQTTASQVVETTYVFPGTSEAPKSEESTLSTTSSASSASSTPSSTSSSSIPSLTTITTTNSNGETTIYVTTCPLTATSASPEVSTSPVTESTVVETKTCTETQCQSSEEESTVPIISSSIVSPPVQSEIQATQVVYTSSVSGQAVTLTTYFTPISTTVSASSQSPESSTGVPAVSVLTENKAATNGILNAGAAVGLALGALLMF